MTEGTTTIRGGREDDILIGPKDHSASISGGDGNDSIQGGDAADRLSGGRGDDTIVGSGGDDYIAGGYGRDLLDGGSGNDTLFAQTGSNTLRGGAGDDLLLGDRGENELYGGDGNDVLTKKSDYGNTLMDGGAGNDRFYVGVIFDEYEATIKGGAGDDSFYLSGASAHLYGGQGADKFSISPSNRPYHFRDFEAEDEILIQGLQAFSSQSVDSVDGATRVTLVGSQDVQIHFYQSLPGTPYFLPGLDWHYEPGKIYFIQDDAAANDRDDVISVKSSAELLAGGGNDLLIGEETDNQLFGEDGDDTLIGGAGADLLSGGTGMDRLEGADGADTLNGDDGDDALLGGAGDDLLVGGTGNDSLDGGVGSDTLNGGFGDDILKSQESPATLSGGDGNDTLFGDITGDELSGGAGFDAFSINQTYDADIHGLDDLTRITDLEPGDEIHLERFRSIESFSVTDNGDGTSLFTASGFPFSRLITTAVIINTLPDVTFVPVPSVSFDIPARVLILSDDFLPQPTEDSDALARLETDDVLDALGGDDTVLAGGGDDTIQGGDGSDSIFGEAGNDMLSGGQHDDTLLGDAGDDHLSGDFGNDRLVGAMGNDTLFGGYGQDYVDAGEGDDHLYGGEDVDNLVGGPGNDLLHGGPGSDKLDGEDGDDRIEGEDGDDKLDGGDGTDTLDGGLGNDNLSGGNGADSLFGGDGDDLLNGGLEDDELFGGDGNDGLVSDTGADTLWGGAGDDVLGVRGLSRDPLLEKNILYGGAGQDQLSYVSGEHVLLGGDGEDSLVASAEGYSTLRGEAGNDSIRGTGAVRIDGGDGDDTIDGAFLGSLISGGLGADVFVLRLIDHSGAGHLTITDFSQDDSLTLASFPDDAELHSNVTGDGTTVLRAIRKPSKPEDFEEIRLFGWGTGAYVVPGTGNGYSVPIQFFAEDWSLHETDHGRFLALSFLDDQFISDDSNSTVAGGPGADNLTGGVGADVLFGGQGADTLLGLDGSDSLSGGLGDDLIDGGAGDDTSDGDAGDDVIDGGDGNDELSGDDGDDTLSGGDGDDRLGGGHGDDLLQGGAGPDSLYGSNGADHLVGGPGDDTLSGGDGHDTLEGGDGDDLLTGSASYASTPPRVNPQVDLIDGGAGNDTIVSGVSDLLALGGTGDDDFRGGAGNDYFEGGAGNDTLDGGAGVDRAYFDRPYDEFTITDFNTVVQIEHTGGDRSLGTDRLFRMERFYFSDIFVYFENDAPRIEGSRFLDWNTGTSASVDLKDLLYDPDEDSFTVSLDDPDELADWLNWDADTWTLSSDDVTDVAGNTTVSIEATDVIGATQTIELVVKVTNNTKFGTSEGESLYASDLDGGRIYGLDGDDSLYGGRQDDLLHGGAGDDFISGKYGNDTLSGGPGNDVIQTWLVDSVIDGGDGDDTLRAKGGDDLLVGGPGDDLISGGAGDDTVRITGDIYSMKHADGGIRVQSDEGSDLVALDVEWLQTDAGTFWMRDLVDAYHVPAVEGTIARDDLRGRSADEVILGHEGDDTLQGDGGGDTLEGGAGNDSHSGGTGVDVVKINDDLLVDGALNVTLTVHADHLVITSEDGTDTIDDDVEEIRFSDDTYDYSAVAAMAGPAPEINGTGAGETLNGTAAAEVINAFGGADWIQPGGGNDTIDGGNGRDMLSLSLFGDSPSRVGGQFRVYLDMEEGVSENHDGSERIEFTSIERLTSTIYTDLVRGTQGDDQIRTLGDYDWIVATAGNDTYDGGTGNDMISFLEFGGTGAATPGFFEGGTLPPADEDLAGVRVDLTNPSKNTGLAANKTLISIERVTGSSFQDVFVGDDSSNNLRGMGGYDWFVASDGGRERYFGGNGIDTVTYHIAPGAITASLINGTPNDDGETGFGSKGWARKDLYFSIENLVGSAFDDSLEGSSAKNQLSGMDGDDIIFGLGGGDQLKGGLGDDTLNGGAGSDRAMYDFDRDEYTLTRTAAKTVTISHATEGTDSLQDVEYFEFADVTVDVWSLPLT